MTGTARGRPLDATRDAAILDATANLLSEVGWDRLTMRAVAERAGVSLATIYRRWDTKTELALAALDSVLATLVDESLVSISELLARRSDLIPSVLALQRAEPGLRDVIRGRFIDPVMTPLEAQVRARARKPLDDDLVSLIALVGPALLMARAVFFNKAPDLDTVKQIERLVDGLVDAATAAVTDCRH
jgi:AcrR family transcriptional regulator